jgi:hypothetical protein
MLYFTYPNIVIDFGIEVDEKYKGEDAEDEEPGPVVVVDGVVGVRPQFGHVQVDLFC